jgi:hypothetical protein
MTSKAASKYWRGSVTRGIVRARGRSSGRWSSQRHGRAGLLVNEQGLRDVAFEVNAAVERSARSCRVMMVG